ncbi:TetR/AcrR family transcriptional regulator [Actinophytocola algeriensis]|jgi:AcrR family transcriptional regulator|uniref:AcrR family transcriptional regulator n=1 Tax=Actinophytocola algeriensis TaxID=1768010 RepID=A0A7W7QBE0_9PSEU|nr:TetR/AcrR family transcriptional regulator [Actinophytocola algeriensis]MBB4910046.1 AcrR family transcriptional regulator [Actinophytocola algeriensis]MBE1476036.1 AcrR family transcriptional regulator [Actinophytocola algeriensis]
MGDKRRYHHGDLRAALVDAALALIAERGVEALSVAETARRTGVSGAAPYRHFPSRLDLLRATAVRAAQLLDAELEVALNSADPVERLAEAGRAYVRFVIRHHAGLDLVFAEQLRGGDAALAAAGRAVMDRLLPIALDLTGDPLAALDLLEQLTAAAHGYAVLHLSGFLRSRAPAVEDIAESAAKLGRALAAAAQQRRG